MKCYVLKSGMALSIGECKIEEVSIEIEKGINEICEKRQVRNLKQTGNSNYDDDGIYSTQVYEPLDPERFVIEDGKVVGYYADHFDVVCLVKFTGEEEKVRLGDYDNSDYRGGSGRVDRGHVAIVKRPDGDTNPYYDEPRFHSQEEYDDYIKWRD